MELLAFSYPTLAVSAIYCLWNMYFRVRLRQERTLRERVVFMLWTMANQIA